MSLRRISLTTAVAALVATPIAAQQSRAELSRASEPVAGENELVGESSLVFILGIAAVAGAVLLLSEDDDPVSP